MPTPDPRRSDERPDGKRRKMSRRRLAMQMKKKRQQFQPDFHGLERRMMPSTFTVTDTSDSDAGSLRQAILNSNSTPGSNTIDFKIGSGAQTISLLSPLPAITVPVLIDGTSQPGYTGAPLIDLDGTGAGTGSNGFDLAAGSRGSTIRALVINNFSLAGILIGSIGDTVQGCYIGTNSAGTAGGATPMTYGVYVVEPGNMIGGNGAGTGNVISDNAYGIVIHGTSATGNVVAGNLIGTNSSGSTPVGNTAYGIVIQNGAAGNWIGVNSLHGPSSANQGNVIAGSSSGGVLIQDSGTTGNVVAGNLIGLNVNSGGQVIDGLGDGFAGVELVSGASGNWIGVNAAAGSGTENALQRNVTSGSYIGVAIYNTGTNGNVVAGNLIGTDPSGTTAVPNQTFDAPISYGVVIAVGASSNLIGTSGQDGVDDALERNVISGNTQVGVYIYGAQGRRPRKMSSPAITSARPKRARPRSQTAMASQSSSGPRTTGSASTPSTAPKTQTKATSSRATRTQGS